VLEHVAQAHDALHRDDIEEVHGQLHAALGREERELARPPLMGYERFDRAFRDLAHAYGVVATYVRFDEDAAPSEQLVTGGNGDLCVFLENAVRAWVGS
jgi:hypothetical protein